MSLFDVIKYPIDNRFLLEDLDRIPANILWNWCIEDIGMDPLGASPTMLHFYMNSIFDGEHPKETYKETLLKELRNRLNEYDEPI